jgi:hypothetical protein
VIVVHTYDYDLSYNPAMPAVEVILGRALAEPILTVQGLVDSGADATIIPFDLLPQLHARKGKQAGLRGVTGTRVMIDLYEVSVQIGSFRLAKVEVVAGRQFDEVIIGRDVLNHFIVTLNGLASAVEISQ